MRRGDRVFGLICLGLSFWLILEASRYDYTTEFTPGPGFAPLWLGVVMGLFSLYLIYQSYKRKGKKEDEERILPGRTSLQRIGLILLLLAGYVVLFMTLGFLLSTFVLVFLLLHLLESYGLLKSFFYGILFSGFASLIFQYWMEVELPRGWFGLGF